MVSEPEPPMRPPHRFLRSVRAGIVIYVIVVALVVTGPGQLFALGAVACGLVMGVLVGLVRWLRGCNFRDALALGAVVGLLGAGFGFRRPR
jgi:hypothetical protein